MFILWLCLIFGIDHWYGKSECVVVSSDKLYQEISCWKILEDSIAVNDMLIVNNEEKMITCVLGVMQWFSARYQVYNCKGANLLSLIFLIIELAVLLYNK